jgi:CBS domain-containing protein
MTVKIILSRKSSDVITIEPSATINQAIKLLVERRIGALIVSARRQEVTGILSERDIVRALAERGPAVLGERVESIMTKKVFTCGEEDSVSQIMERMTQGKFRHVPVVDGKRLVGVVSIGDVVKYRLEEIETESNALKDYILTA